MYEATIHFHLLSVLLIYMLISTECYKFDLQNIFRPRRSSDCGLDDYQCDSGQCISDTEICDGTAQCSDKSDETMKVCGKLECPGYTFQCTYGACIKYEDICNGKRDCIDGSDEHHSICVGSKVLQESNKCLLPNNPKHGTYILINNNDAEPGNLVNEGSELITECHKNYILSSNITKIYCQGKQWVPHLPKCINVYHNVTCSLTDKINAEAECTINNKQVSCEHPLTGTIAKFTCKPFHEDLNLAKTPFRHCKDGKWDQPLPECTPVCGRKLNEQTQTNIQNKKSNYPWQAAVYKRNANNTEQVCGGSVITLRAVLTAAHCLTFEDGKTESVQSFLIGVGKYYRFYKDVRDNERAQYIEVQEIKIPNDYHGDNTNYASDIAVIVLKNEIILSVYVQPVCIDWYGLYESVPDEYGIITGWGNFSEELKEMEVPFVSYTQCRANLPRDFAKYLLPDKICSGRLGEGNKVCQGDSGGGLCLQSDDDKYYIQGIVSVSPRNDKTCNVDHYVLYTKVSDHLHFVQNSIAFE